MIIFVSAGLKGKLFATADIAAVSLINACPLSRYSKKLHGWEITLSPKSIGFLRQTKHNNITQVKMTEKAITAIENFEAILEKHKEIPFPIGYRFKTAPFAHQKEALDKIYGLNRCALLMEQGTGKSKVAIDLTCEAFLAGKIKALLLVCPYSIRTNWREQFETHAPFPVDFVVYDTSKVVSKREIDRICATFEGKMLKVLAIGVESLSGKKFKGNAFDSCVSFLNNNSAMMIVDESHTIKNHRAQRAKNCVALGQNAPMKMIMTGTPITRSLLDMFMPFEFLSPHILGLGNFYSFKRHYAIMGGYENKEVIGYNHTEELMASMRPYIYECIKDDVLDLPDKLFITRKVELSTQQREAYIELKKNKFLEISGDENKQLLLTNVLALYTSLQRIVGGYLRIDEELLELTVPENNPKIKAVLEIVEESQGGVIIWAKYLSEIAAICKVLRKIYGTQRVVEFHGGVSPEERDSAVARFQKGEAVFFVSNPQTGGTGLTLNAAKTVIYFDNSFSFVSRSQSEDRCHRIGQTNAVLYVDLVATIKGKATVDSRILASLKEKQDLSNFVYQSFSTKGLIVDDI